MSDMMLLGMRISFDEGVDDSVYSLFSLFLTGSSDRLERFLGNYNVPLAYVDGNKVALLAQLDYKEPSNDDLLDCLVNLEQVRFIRIGCISVVFFCCLCFRDLLASDDHFMLAKRVYCTCLFHRPIIHCAPSETVDVFLCFFAYCHSHPSISSLFVFYTSVVLYQPIIAMVMSLCRFWSLSSFLEEDTEEVTRREAPRWCCSQFTEVISAASSSGNRCTDIRLEHVVMFVLAGFTLLLLLLRLLLLRLLLLRLLLRLVCLFVCLFACFWCWRETDCVDIAVVLYYTKTMEDTHHVPTSNQGKT